MASNLVDQVQTGGLSESLNISVENFAMAEPVPEPVDPTGGIRATNESGTLGLGAEITWNYVMDKKGTLQKR